MNSEPPQMRFQRAQRKATRFGTFPAFIGQDLATIGESLYCYVPRMLRQLTLERLLTIHYEDATSVYPEGSWAIDDLIRLLERIADEAGIAESEATADFVPLTNGDGSLVENETDHSVPTNHGDESVAPDSRVSHKDEHPAIEPGQTSTEQETKSCVNNGAMEAEFVSMRQVLLTHGAHPSLDEELREFLEPRDTEIPTKFLGNSVRQVLEIPFTRLARSWVGRGHVECLLKLLERAVASIHSVTGYSDENAAYSDKSPRTETETVPRELYADGKIWRASCEAIHNAGLQHLRLGMVSECLRDLSVGLWDQPLTKFTTLPIAKVAEIFGVGPTRFKSVVAAVRGLAVELMDLPYRTSVRFKFIPGPLRAAQEWIERTLESRSVPDSDELTIRLLRPFAQQIRRDLADRESQIAIHRLQLNESSTKQTLEELATVHGVSRERIRQLEKWGPMVLQVRFPQGRYLLEALHIQFAAVPGAHQQASCVRRIAMLCFDSEVLPESRSNEVGAAWEEAGGLKLTPMTAEHVLEWSKNRLPTFPPNSILEAIRSEALFWKPDGRALLWFTRTEIDRILFVLYQQQAPVRLGELILLDKIQNGYGSVDGELTSKLNPNDERSLWGRIRRDPRFVECDDHHELLPSESCGFERLNGSWMIQLYLKSNSGSESRRHLPVDALVRLVVAEMRKLGIVDATVSGVHRFARELLSKMFRASLYDGITPLVLADMLVKLGDDRIRTMRRRRLRWDASDSSLKALGKRGWVGHVVSDFGRPMVLTELDGLLRQHYQDYADHVVNQMAYAMDEDGDADDRVQFVSELGHGIPTLIVPTSWRLDTVQDNVSDGVLEVVRQLANQVLSEKFDVGELKSVGWLRSLVETCVLANAVAGEEQEVNRSPHPAKPSQKASACPIIVSRVGNEQMPELHPIPAFILIHGQRENGTINWKGMNTRCTQCGRAIAQGESYAVEDMEHNGVRLLLFLSDISMRRWCLKCIDYERVTESQTAPTPNEPALVELQFNRHGLLLKPSTTNPNRPTPNSATVGLSAAQLGELHLTTDCSRVLFADLDQPVENLFGYTFARIRACAPFHRPWSLAELRLTEEDVEWLKRLFEQTATSNLRQLLSTPSRFVGYSRDAQLGAVLLLLESELARRHASEGQLWSAIHQQVAWHEDTSRFLFNQRQPNARHKACLEAATKELGLRSAFGEDSAQEWYQSVFLQCGFSKKSFEKRLPEWLGGQNALVSVHRLLDDERYASPSFKELWTALDEYRHGKLERARLKSILESSPWVLPDWHESLIELCRASIKSSDGGGERVGAPFTEGSSKDDVATREAAIDGNFLGSPQLRLSVSGLEFVCDVAITELPDLADDACDVLIDGRVVSTILLQVDGSLFITQNKIKLPTSSAIVAAELRTRSGERIAEQSLVLWDDSDDVDGYVVKTGRRISSYSREFAERESLLIFKSDLRIEPTQLTVGSLADGSRTVVRLLPNETARTRLFLGDALLWEPAVRLHPAWRDRVVTEVDVRPRESPTQFRIRVTHPTDVTATSCRFRRALLEVPHESDRVSTSEWLPLDAEIRSVEVITFTVLLRRGDEKTELRRRVPFRLPGNLWRRTDRWEQVPSRGTSDLRELRQIDFRLSPPEAEVEEQHWQVFEGRRWIASVSERPQRFNDVEGWGSPLTLRTGPYNSCQPEQPLLRSVTNTGMVRDVSLSVDSSTIEIVLDRIIEPDESHMFVVFDDYGELTFVEGIEFSVETPDGSYGCVWRTTLPNQRQDRRVMAVAIAYNGERLGSWWQSNWTEALRRPGEVADETVTEWASRVADVVRWVRLPLLSPDDFPKVRGFVKAYAVPVLATWLSRGQSNPLAQDAVGEGWLCVVRAIFADWLPTPKDARDLDSLLESTLSDGNAFPLKTTLSALGIVSPLLAARVIRAWLADAAVSGIDLRQSRAVVGELRKQVLGRETVESLTRRVAQDVARSDEPPDGTLDFVRDSLLAKCLSLLDQPDSAVVTDVDRGNIEIAMRLDPHRTLVLVESLDRISKELA